MNLNYRSLNPPPDYNLLPKTVVRAELLLGSLVRCGPGVRGIGWPDSALVRASTLNHLNPHNLVLVLSTASFVWGYVWEPKRSIHFSTLNGKRHLYPPGLGIEIHEFSIHSSQTVELGRAMVTSPLRTVYDLLFEDESNYLSFGEQASRFLIRKYGLEYLTLRSELDAKRRPYRNKARQRALELYN